MNTSKRSHSERDRSATENMVSTPCGIGDQANFHVEQRRWLGQNAFLQHFPRLEGEKDKALNPALITASATLDDRHSGQSLSISHPMTRNIHIWVVSSVFYEIRRWLSSVTPLDLLMDLRASPDGVADTLIEV